MDQLSENKHKMKSFPSDTVIIKEGERSDTLYKILSGSVEVYMHYGTNEEHLIGIYSKGRCFGEWSMLTGEPNPYTIISYDKVLLLEVSNDSLEDFIKNNPKNAVHIMSNIAQSLNLMQKHIDLLLEELYAKEQDSRQANDMLTQKLKNYQKTWATDIIACQFSDKF